MAKNSPPLATRKGFGAGCGISPLPLGTRLKTPHQCGSLYRWGKPRTNNEIQRNLNKRRSQSMAGNKKTDTAKTAEKQPYVPYDKMTAREQGIFKQGIRAKETSTKKALGFFVPTRQA